MRQREYVTAGETVGISSIFDDETENTLILLGFQLLLAAKQMGIGL